jgi:RNA polymerase sigma factor (TIGR02999 family)
MDGHSSSESGITVLLRAWNGGDHQALEKLIPLVYRELHRTARRYMARESPGHILQSTALVNETYLELEKLGEIDWQDRGHFYAVCAQLMRRTLTNYARSRLFKKRGGDAQRVHFDESWVVSGDSRTDLIALDEALNQLALIDERKSQIVQLRFFVGLSVAETAVVLKVSEETVSRDWRLAKVWLLRELSAGNQVAGKNNEK